MSDDSGEQSGNTVAERPQNKHLRPWPKGMSGNPSGRAKGSVSISAAYRRQLAEKVPDDPKGRTYADLLAAVVVKLACKGNIRAAIELADRLEGKAKATLDVKHTGDARQRIANLLNMDPDEIPPPEDFVN